MEKFADVHLFSNDGKYTRVLPSLDISGVFFPRAHFQKIAQISNLCNFYYISEGIPSLMCFGLLKT